MTSNLLHCNICPKGPEFSDISHLLTHVASKGHLAQQFKAQVRARQDASIRAKLDTYDRWYDRHQIEKLLSERMIAKDSKDSTARTTKSKATTDPTASTDGTKPRKRQSKSFMKPEDRDSPVKIEGVLDPQLCHSVSASRSRSRQISASVDPSLRNYHDSQRDVSEQLMAAAFPSPFLDQSQFDYNPRTYVPRMSEWQDANSPHPAAAETTSMESKFRPPPPSGYETDGENDYFQAFLRSPTKTAYPDPSDATVQRPDFLDDSSASVVKRDVRMEQMDRDLDAKDSIVKATSSILHSPVLKGVKWPGMSLFDSASLDAQRLRNQKKHDSVIEQMEHSSELVEQMERIYWPDGTLKKERLITGNVESSPIREPTPPPKLPKRKLVKLDKPVLGSLSTNTPLLGKKLRASKVAPPASAAQAPDLRTISTEALAELDHSQYVYPRSAHINYNPPINEESEREPMNGLPKMRRRKAFRIFNDQLEGIEDVESPSISKVKHPASSQSLHGHQKSPQPNVSSFLPHKVQKPSPRFESSSQIAWDAQIRSAKGLCRAPRHWGDENIAPVLDENGRIDDGAVPVHTERATQRYFSVNDTQPPQFYSAMPPGMDFGGLMGPRYHGATLNPLNPYISQHRFMHSRARAVFSPPAVGFSNEAVRGQEGSEEPYLRGQGSRTSEKRE